MMRRALIVLLGVLLLAALPSLAEAGGKHGRYGYGYHKGHGGHSYRGGYRYNHGAYFWFWPAPLWWGPRWYPAYAYPYGHPSHHETTVIVEERPVYVQRPPSTAPAESWWYYCESAGGYYPNVATCPERWVKVPPRPESSRSPQ
jgi:hypothetical protein